MGKRLIKRRMIKIKKILRPVLKENKKVIIMTMEVLDIGAKMSIKYD